MVLKQDIAMELAAPEVLTSNYDKPGSSLKGSKFRRCTATLVTFKQVVIDPVASFPVIAPAARFVCTVGRIVLMSGAVPVPASAPKVDDASSGCSSSCLAPEPEIHRGR